VTRSAGSSRTFLLRSGGGLDFRTHLCSVAVILAGEHVNRILIKCPNTGKLIYTGFAMDLDTFEASPVEEMDPIECPACHKTHRWKKQDVILERETPTIPKAKPNS
jgi:hypothetical protein